MSAIDFEFDVDEKVKVKDEDIFGVIIAATVSVSGRSYVVLDSNGNTCQYDESRLETDGPRWVIRVTHKKTQYSYYYGDYRGYHMASSFFACTKFKAKTQAESALNELNKNVGWAMNYSFEIIRV